MSLSRYILFCLGLILVNSLAQPAIAQLGFNLKIDKPKPYEERVLRAEKPQDKPLRPQGRFFQNLTTHYNYFFNANVKINEVIDAAKAAHKDDYTNLLPFYNYSLEATASNSRELDSVIYKAQTGIVMHDLRNDWIDNLYLLWGAAWFLEKKFDSASLMFQFINYAFAEKEKDGYYKYIGSRLDGNNALSISTKEKAKNITTPPSRNNAFIWQARTFIEMGRMAEASSLIATLRNDPLFPERLKEDLEEVHAYWFYKQGMYDSSATHLLKALGQAQNKQEKARWEFLAAQMLERSGKTDEAREWYNRSIAHTTDPVMDVYARLNIVRIQKDTTGNYIDRNIAELLKMARRDKYVDYRDVIYYMAAQMELERNNFSAAQKHLLKSAKYNNNNLASGSRIYLKVADLSFDQKSFHEAARFYDSVKTDQLNEDESDRVNTRKDMLARLLAFSGTISREDSLQRIAAMPEEQRNEYINDLVKLLRKQQGLDDITPVSGGSAGSGPAPDLFSSQPKGEWYFYNATLKKQGNNQFRQTWGSRPNVDNWRRFSAVSQQLNTNQLNPVKGATRTNETNDQADNSPTFESLLKNVPLTPEQIKASNDSIRMALSELGKLYLTEMNDYATAISLFEQLRIRFPDRDHFNEEVLFNLYYAYIKSGDEGKADQVKTALLGYYPDTRFAAILSTGKDPSAANSRAEVTKAYEEIYDLFLEGRFTEAIAARKTADSLYSTSFWEPQLLYIEAVYHIRQRNDSSAIHALQTIINQDANAPLAIKAQTLIDVLNRRHEIEAELTALQIKRPEEEVVKIPEHTVVQNTPRVQAQRDSTIQVIRPQVQDSSSNPRPDLIVRNGPKPVVDSAVIRNHLEKERQDSLDRALALQIEKDSIARVAALENDKRIQDSLAAIASGKKDTAAVAVTQPKKDSVFSNPVISQPVLHSSGYLIDSMNRHYAVVILDKVDPLFVNEVKNAFYHFGRNRYYDKNFEYTLHDLDAEKKLLVINGFSNAREAHDFILNARPASASEIMPWLRSDKYAFTVITEKNLETLLREKDLSVYSQFLDQTLRIK